MQTAQQTATGVDIHAPYSSSAVFDSAMTVFQKCQKGARGPRAGQTLPPWWPLFVKINFAAGDSSPLVADSCCPVVEVRASSLVCGIHVQQHQGNVHCMGTSVVCPAREPFSTAVQPDSLELQRPWTRKVSLKRHHSDAKLRARYTQHAGCCVLPRLFDGVLCAGTALRAHNHAPLQ
jgi:hypothetical protein